MSRESTSVHLEAITDGDGGDVSGDCALSPENPLAIDYESRETLLRENNEEREKAAMITTSIWRRAVGPKNTTTLKFKAYDEWAMILTVVVVTCGVLIVTSILIYCSFSQVECKNFV